MKRSRPGEPRRQPKRQGGAQFPDLPETYKRGEPVFDLSLPEIDLTLGKVDLEPLVVELEPLLPLLEPLKIDLGPLPEPSLEALPPLNLELPEVDS